MKIVRALQACIQPVGFTGASVGYRRAPDESASPSLPSYGEKWR